MGRVLKGWRLVAALLCAALALLPLLLVVPAWAGTEATYNSTDNFHAGTTPDLSIHPTLTITKRLTATGGHKATGSSQDAARARRAPGIGVQFTLTQIEPTAGHTAGQMKPPATPGADDGTYTRIGPVYKGTTDSKGMIVTGGVKGPGDSGVWLNASDGALAQLPAGEHYYLLEETSSPYNTGTDGYKMAEPSIFDLPYRATNSTKTTDASGNVTSTTSEDGFVYNVHIFPKNKTEQQLTKRAVEVKDAAGNARSDLVAQAGDTITWEITQRFYDETRHAGLSYDGKLDLSEMTQCLTTGPHPDCYEMEDRLPSSLQYVPHSSHAEGSWEEEDGTEHTTDMNMANDDGTSHAGASKLPLDPYSSDDGTISVAGPRWPVWNWNGNLNSTPLMYDSWSQGTTFLHYIWNKIDFARAFSPSVAAKHLNMRVTITYQTKVTSVGDSEASPAGELLNTVHVDHVDNFDNTSGTLKPRPLITASAWVPSAGLQFAKTNLQSNLGVVDAVFRLTKPDDKTSFLYSDGNFYKTGDPVPAGVTVVEARANKTSESQSFIPNYAAAQPNGQGIVTFVGLPIFGADGKVRSDANQLKFGLLEYSGGHTHILQDPGIPFDPSSNPYINTAYQFSPTLFTTVDLSQYQGSAPETLVYNHTKLAADTSQLALRDYAAHITAGTFKNAENQDVTVGVVNWTQSESDPFSGALPLTGGVGIGIMLLAGLTLMAFILWLLHDRFLHNFLPSGRHRAY
ncbi:hypothetical protein KIM372_13290 [Bombiscardovia nodaiensis]|uniref:Prealbumin-like fold domain-containing protein n=1 Tax=Bombiscardovia nodaiensis TaxID=2932181 RepID=A0ABM8B950_9BIFI|nr:hypothetical protein KIM372_13290 [Bombiscardovia nodaiensis]